MTWIDISVPIRPGMPIYEGDPAVGLERVTSLAIGDLANVSRLDFGVHTGTHIDAPVHFLDGGGGVESLSPEALIGPAFVADATHLTADIDAAALRTVGIPSGVERLLLKTHNSRLWDLDHFSDDFIGLTDDAAREVIARGIRLVGIDYLSIAPRHDPAPTHRALLEAGVVILEGLDLRRVSAGSYELVALPLLIPGSDGGPTRALLNSRSTIE